jgi:hypothetical protein
MTTKSSDGIASLQVDMRALKTELRKATSNTYFKHYAAMISSFDGLRHLTVTCKSETKHLTTYVAYFRFAIVFSTRNHTAAGLSNPKQAASNREGNIRCINTSPPMGALGEY